MAHYDEHHHHNKNLQGKRLLWVTLLNLSITLVQIIGGLIANSLSLLSDALHNLGDSSAIFIAFVAGKISKRKPDTKNTFGYKRVEILAALFNAIVLIAICIFLFYEAYKRFMHPESIKGGLMLVVATFGLLANFISILILHKDKSHNLNVKAAYLHLLGDTLSSVAVIAGGLAIWIWKVYWIDPLITVLVGIYIIWHTWGVVKETIDILMQSTPHEINLDELKAQVEQLDQVDNIHHVHVWKLNDSQTHLEAHLNLKNNIDMMEMMAVREQTEKLLHEKFGIDHITLQIEYNSCPQNSLLINRSN
ncbi:MAG: cation transporter [Draconibacterium sp.]|nr:MAG: cation transporter [Draconibacterium sp.]